MLVTLDLGMRPAVGYLGPGNEARCWLTLDLGMRPGMC